MNVGKNKTIVYATPNYNTVFGIAQERSETDFDLKSCVHLGQLTDQGHRKSSCPDSLPEMNATNKVHKLWSEMWLATIP